MAWRTPLKNYPRKQKQVHVKCVCELKDYPQQGVFTSRAFIYGWLIDKIAFYASHYPISKPGFESPAFPTGLPPASGASVAFPNSADGTSSDSDPGGMQPLARRHLPR